MFSFHSVTHTVQDFALQYLQNGLVNVTCYFAANSSADGCQITFTSMESKDTTTFNVIKTSLARDVAIGFVNVEPGEYCVNVHDIVNINTNSNSCLKEKNTFRVPDHMVSSSSSGQ